MAQRTKAQLATDITTYIKDNGGSDPTRTKGSEQRILEQNIVDSLLAYEEETTQAVIQNEATTEANKFVSARRFWQGITRFLAIAWTWAEKQLFSKGINVGNNTSPSANGDIWYNTTSNSLQARVNSLNVDITPPNLQSVIAGETSLVAGTRTINDSRVTANSVVLIGASTTGTLTADLKYAKSAGVGVTFTAGGSDTCTFSYLIIF